MIGLTKGGLNSKLHAVTDVLGRPIRMFLCHCTLINQILRIERLLGCFCTLNYKISTGSIWMVFERRQLLFARPYCFRSFQ